MNRTALLKRLGRILLRTPALWVVTLIAVLVQTLPGFALTDQSIAASLIQTAIVFIITAFTTGALIGLTNLAAQNEPASIGDGIRSGLRNLAPLLIASIVLMIPVWLTLGVYTLVGSGSISDLILSGLVQPNSLQINDVLNNLGGLLSVVGVIFAVSLLVHAISVGVERAIVIDKQSILDAIKQGYTLLRTKFADFIAWGLVLTVAILAVQMIVALIFGQLIGVPEISQTTLGGILVTFNLITGVLTTVVIAVLWTLVYREWQTPTPVEEMPDNKRVAKKKG